MPVWISSTISSSPRCWVSARNSCMNASVAGHTPASPWIGSSITATVDGEISRRTESMSFSRALRKPETLGSNSGSNAFLPDADMVASVRP